jgi:hypothetical protein
LASAYVKDFSENGKTKSLLYKQAKGDAYILAINRFLKNNDKVFLGYLTEIAAKVGYSIKPNGFSTDKTANVKLINDIFVRELADLIKVVPKEIGLPTAQLNSTGKAAIEESLENPPAGRRKIQGGGGIQTFVYSESQEARRNQVLDFKMNMPGIENIDSKSLDGYISRGEALIEDIRPFPNMEQDRIALTEAVAGLKKWVSTTQIALFNDPDFDEAVGTTIYEKVFDEELSPDKEELQTPRAVALGDILFELNPSSAKTLNEVIATLYNTIETDSFEEIRAYMEQDITDDADRLMITTILDKNCAI